MNSKTISEKVIYYRKLKGYSQEKLSHETSVTIRTIQRIEKGEVNPHLQTIKLLAVGLGVDVDDLIALENPKEESLQLKWLLLMHSTPLIGFVLPLFNILLPLFLWIHKREDNQIYNIHGRKIINFQITMTLLYVLALIALVTIEGYGFFFFILVIPYAVIVIIINIITTLQSQKSYYPLSIPFLRGKKSSKLAMLLLTILICSCNSPKDNIERLDGTIISKDSLTSKINQLVKDANVHGASISIFNNNKVTYSKTFGYKDFVLKEELTDSTNLYGASFSKAVFGVLVMKLVEDGLIDLDTPLETYLPKKIYEYKPLLKWHDDFSALKKDSLYHKITARMCLNHSTSFMNTRWQEPDYQLRTHFEPGTRYSYSLEGFNYLQVVLEKLTNKPLEELAQEIIFNPLGMKNSSYTWKKEFENNLAYGHNAKDERYVRDTDNDPRAGSTLQTTLKDYTKFLEAVLQQKILNKNSWEEFYKPSIRIRSLSQFGPLAKKDSTLNDDIKLSYGLGWGVLDSPYGKGYFKEGHANTAFEHYSIIFPEAGTGITIMTNSVNGESIFKELLEVAIKDVYTPWKWENYIPYNHNEKEE